MGQSISLFILLLAEFSSLWLKDRGPHFIADYQLRDVLLPSLAHGPLSSPSESNKAGLGLYVSSLLLQPVKVLHS